MDCNHLQDVRAKVVREITGLTEQQLNAKQRHDVWSIGQICHHLILSEGAFADAIEQGLKNDQESVVREKPIERALDRSVKTDAPKNILPNEGPFQVSQILEGFEHSRRHFLRVIERVSPEEDYTHKSVRHPKFGQLSIKQWIELLPYHETRHIEQIQELKADLSINV
ncbi:DinB family protein [Geomicrobium sediminis]|uniref:Damage-inducible protein DinB n=1 Tax=Geomicrobium sediminis TaxID=1347788 RepID=A0ABS2PC93_9BACL|nr:DinB family protein [Geomicrobium sediminis]MBM7632939.1 putative damage-inducible protein DinB [Geomicrobium sediminis]